MSSIVSQIDPEHLKLFAFEFGKIAETDFVYTLTSTNIIRSALNSVKMYVTISFQMSLIMNVIGPELSELFALEFAKIAEPDCLYPSIYKSRPISTNHGHDKYDDEILDEFNYGSNPTVTSGVICPSKRKNCLI